MLCNNRVARNGIKHRKIISVLNFFWISSNLCVCLVTFWVYTSLHQEISGWLPPLLAVPPCFEELGWIWSSEGPWLLAASGGGKFCYFALKTVVFQRKNSTELRKFSRLRRIKSPFLKVNLAMRAEGARKNSCIC